MSAHSASPWFARLNDFSRWEIFSNLGQLASVAQPGDPASPPKDWHECAANARLIAAAPDLLDALRELQRLAGGPVGGVTQEMKRTAMDAARNAIAKATKS
jgi:hypothetical protein